METERIIINEPNTVDLVVNMKGIRDTDTVSAKFIVETPLASLSFDGHFKGDNLSVEIPVLQHFVKNGEDCTCRLEVFVNDQKHKVELDSKFEFIEQSFKVQKIAVTSKESEEELEEKDEEVEEIEEKDEEVEEFDDFEEPICKELQELEGFEVKRLGFEMKSLSANGQFEGYLSVFGNVDSHGDVVKPGAFKKTLKERPNVKLLWQHDTHKPIGVFTSIKEDNYGLKVSGQFALDVQQGREAYSLLRMGALDGMSIGYIPVKTSVDKKAGVRYLNEAKLIEGSVVTLPSNEMATISSVKNSFELLNTKDKDKVFNFVRDLKTRFGEPIDSHSPETVKDEQELIETFVKSLQPKEPLVKHSPSQEADSKEETDAIEQSVQQLLNSIKEINNDK